MDLNEDCQVLIVEHLETKDLLSLADAINTPLNAIEYVFKRRCEQKTVQLLQIHGNSIAAQFDAAKKICVSGFAIILKLFRSFGHLIKDLQIIMSLTDPNSRENKIPEIFQLINAHCSDSLTSFTIYNSGNIVVSFEEFKTPFERVTNIDLKGSFYSLNSSNLSFQEIFPALQELTINRFFQLDDKSSLEVNFPHLETLNAHIWTLNYEKRGKFDGETCEKFIQNNRQIREITLIDATRNVLKSMADQLPNIDYIKLKNYKEDENDNEPIAIHFRNLKMLIIDRENGVSLPARLTFDQLEVFSTGTYNIFCDRWLHLVNTQNTLKVLKVERNLVLSDFAQLANVNSSLVEMHIKCPSTNFNEEELVSKIGHLVHMLDNNQHLQKLVLSIGYENIGTVLDALQDQLSSNWTTRPTEDEHFIYVERFTMNH